MGAPYGPAEKRRLEGIEELAALEVGSSGLLDRVVRLAAALMGAPSAAIHILDHEHQHRVAAVNAPLGEGPRRDSLCRLVVEQGEGVSTPDATQEPQFAYSSFVTGESPVRFYTSAPIRTELYGTLGTVCAWDTEVHDEPADLTLLDDLAAIVVDWLRARRVLRILAEEATSDALTGLPNRRLVQDRLTSALARRQRDGSAVVAAYVDLDDFKPVNDRHGHDIGDLVLRHVADMLSAVCRGDEVVGRVGGDEFVIIGGEGMQAPAALLRFTRALQTPLDTPVGRLTASASIGTAVAIDGDTADSLLRRADGAMFEVKALVGDPQRPDQR